MPDNMFEEWYDVPLTWYPPLNWNNYVDTELYTNNYTFLQKYLTCFYHAVLMLG